MDITSIPADKLEEFESAQKEYASLLGSSGGKATASRHSTEWYRDNQKKSVESRKRNRTAK